MIKWASLKLRAHFSFGEGEVSKARLRDAQILKKVFYTITKTIRLNFNC